MNATLEAAAHAACDARKAEGKAYEAYRAAKGARRIELNRAWQRACSNLVAANYEFNVQVRIWAEANL